MGIFKLAINLNEFMQKKDIINAFFFLYFDTSNKRIRKLMLYLFLKKNKQGTFNSNQMFAPCAESEKQSKINTSQRKNNNIFYI